MNDWTMVKLTEARQVAALIGIDEDDWPMASVGVRDRYAALRRQGTLGAAVEYLGHALPRREAVSWAGRLLDDESRRIELTRRSRLALDSAMRWIGEPTDAHRRAAHDAARAISKAAPERFLGLAVFYSGGSVGGTGAPLAPPLHACSRFAVSAIEQAAYRSADSAAFFQPRTRSRRAGRRAGYRGSGATMTLTLTLQNSGRLDNGAPLELVLHRRGAIIGRASTCDWPLPDPTKHISARHFEVTFDGRFYVLTDTSTNGTFLNGASERLSSPHRITQGDRFQVGPYLIRASLSGEAEASLRSADAAAATPGPRAWAGWDDGTSAAAPDDASSAGSNSGGGWGAPPANSGWDAAPPPPPRDNARWQPEVGPSLARPDAHRQAGGQDGNYGRDRTPAPAGSGWAPSGAVALPPVASAWESPAPDTDPASGWSSAAPDRPAAPSPDDVWGRIAEGNVVDWARGGFGQPIAPGRSAWPQPRSCQPIAAGGAPGCASTAAACRPGSGGSRFLCSSRASTGLDRRPSNRAQTGRRRISPAGGGPGGDGRSARPRKGAARCRGDRILGTRP